MPSATTCCAKTRPCLHVKSESDVRAVVAKVRRRVLLVRPVVAQESAFDEEGCPGDGEGYADAVLEHLVLDRSLSDSGDELLGSHQLRIVIEAAVQREEMVEIGQLFYPDSPSVLLPRAA